MYTCSGVSPILTASFAFLNCSSNGLTFWRSWKSPTSSPYLINLVGVGVWSAKTNVVLLKFNRTIALKLQSNNLLQTS